MKKIIAMTLVMLMLFASMVSASALSPIPPYDNGDVNMSRELSISDATLIQKYVADMVELNKLQANLADTDDDGEVTVKDATLIQKKIAELECDWKYKYAYDYLFLYTFISDYASGVAASGDEVTFTADAWSFNSSVTYEFYVDDNVVSSGDEPQFTYRFDSAGTYKVGVTAVDKLGVTGSYSMDYEVIEASQLPDSVYVKAFYYEYNLKDVYPHEGEMTAVAAGGSGEYEYEFMRDGEIFREYSSCPTCAFPEWSGSGVGYHTFTVNVKDLSDGSVASYDIAVDATVM